MMETVKAMYADPARWDGQRVELGGWVRTLRDSKHFGFMELNDGSFFRNAQIVLDGEATENFAEALRIRPGSAVRVEGTFLNTPEARQPFEIKAARVTLVGDCDGDYPLQKKRHSMEYLRTIAHLRPRTNTFMAVLRVRSLLAYAIHTFFNERGFVYVHTPILTASDCEGAGEMFQVTTCELGQPYDEAEDFFGKRAGLTVSGQLNVETHCMAFGKVYTFGPTFRAEHSNTPRHAAEFWMVEPEIAFAGLAEDMRLAEDMTKFIIRFVRERAPEEMAFFEKHIASGLNERLDNIERNDFAHVTYTEAVELLEKSGEKFQYPVRWGMDLQTEHERYLTEKTFGRPVFVTDYPKEIKAFYMRMNDDGKTVAAMDMLVPGVGELIGGSQREERLDVLMARMAELNLDPEAYSWYLDLRRYGGVEHAGFGLGFERMVMYMTGIPNIRDVQSFPRTTGSIDF